jgi:histidinol-phosphate/aromatic aminotransferase/cobyric acid decarboxylase-like protein
MFHSNENPEGATLTLIRDIEDTIDTELNYYPYYNLTAEQKK